jgi:uncharacterized protein
MDFPTPWDTIQEVTPFRSTPMTDSTDDPHESPVGQASPQGPLTPQKGSRLKRLKAKVRHAAFTAAPIWISQGSITRRHEKKDISVVERDLFIPSLPPGLEGLKITHLSDLHIGKLTTPKQLATIVQKANSLQSNLIAVTGDFLDLSCKYLGDIVAQMHQLKAPLGVHMVAGNHDYLDNAAQFIDTFRTAKLGLLLNQSVQVKHNGVKFIVAGIDYNDAPSLTAAMVHRTLKSADKHHPGAQLKLLLAHHPDAFDAAVRHGVALTLAGHTHGGQFVLSNSHGKKGSLGLGAMTFQYPRGLYRRGNNYLYVNSGVGSWFPMRINCPAEIAILTLRSAPASSESQILPGEASV